MIGKKLDKRFGSLCILVIIFLFTDESGEGGWWGMAGGGVLNGPEKEQLLY